MPMRNVDSAKAALAASNNKVPVTTRAIFMAGSPLQGIDGA